MPLINVLSAQVRPEKIRRYEELVQRFAERAVAKGEDWHWTAHQFATGEAGSFAFVSELENFAALGARGDTPDLFDRVLGRAEAEKFMMETGECTVSQRNEFSVDRPDLSCLPDEVDRSYPAALLTVIRALTGRREACEELIRKLSEAIPKVDDPARMITYQTVLGDLSQYWTVRPIADLAELDQQRQPLELLTEAFGGAEGGLIFRTGLEAIEHAERSVVMYRPELSNPK